MPNLVALIDWDGTIRRGFTMIQWVQYICASGAISPKITTELESLFADYAAGLLSHDNLAQASAKLYSEGIAGCQETDIASLAKVFHTIDCRSLLSESVRLLTYLSDNGVQLIAISGSPMETLHLFTNELGFHRMYGLQCEVKNGRYSGNIIYNPGNAKTKQAIVTKLIHENKLEVIAGIGNSSSDIPLFREAAVAVVVDNPMLSVGDRKVIHIDSSGSCNEAIASLSEEIARHD